MTGLQDLGGARVFIFDPDGPRLSTDRHATDLIGEAYGSDAAVVVLPAARLTDDVLDLSTRLAGEFIQKFVNYGFHLVILGDISARVAASSALRDFVYESNRGRHVWFVEDLADLESRLSQTF